MCLSFFASRLLSAISIATLVSHLLFFGSLAFGMLFLASSFTIASTSCHCSSGSLSIRSNDANLFFTSAAHLSGMSHKLYAGPICFLFQFFFRLLQLDLYRRNKQLMFCRGLPQSAPGIVFLVLQCFANAFEPRYDRFDLDMYMSI